VKQLAEARRVTPAQLALPWLLTRGKDITPTPGTTTRNHLAENAAATEIALTRDELERIDEVAPKGAASGLPYPERLTKVVGL
jgi:aryl-alcohol dehydrogenase-like predicted oxidoreductase